MKLLKILGILPLMLFYAGCERDDNTVFNEYLVFQNSYEIEVPPYWYYTDSGDSVFVRGDQSYNSGTIDTLTSTPVLAWDSVESKLLCAAIFKESIKIENYNITNDTSEIVWIWHSGLPEGVNGLVEFDQGIGKMNLSESEQLIKPDSLEQGHIYFWCVWGWNASGTKINFSSRELRFIVR